MPTRRVVSFVAWLTLGCGGKAQESRQSEADSAGRAGTAPDTCADLESNAADALRALVAANNACQADQDCVNVGGIGTCSTYCVVPVQRSNLGAVLEAGQEICRAYVEHGCHAAVTCPNSPAAGCVAGRCAFR